jgi:hypothetical protein
MVVPSQLPSRVPALRKSNLGRERELICQHHNTPEHIASLWRDLSDLSPQETKKRRTTLQNWSAHHECMGLVKVSLIKANKIGDVTFESCN